MKYRCIKDIGGLNTLTVGKIYEIESLSNRWIDFYRVINDYGRTVDLSDETLPKYFEKVEE